MLFCVYILFSIVYHVFNPYPDPYAHLVTGFIILAILLLVYIIGLASVIRSLLRGEKFRHWAWGCLFFYLLILATGFLVVSFGTGH
jgi:heme A synthase